MIKYFWEGLQSSIQAQFDVRERDLDSWDEVVDKTVDIKTKVSSQAPSGIREIDSWCSQDQLLSKKDDKDSKDFKKNKSSQNPPANTSLSSSGI